MSSCRCGQFDLGDRYCKVVGAGEKTEIHRPSCDGWSYCCHGGPNKEHWCCDRYQKSMLAATYDGREDDPEDDVHDVWCER